MGPDLPTRGTGSLLNGCGFAVVAVIPAIGYSLPVKAALPVAQLLFLPLAFGGGLLLPPMLFPGWLQTVSMLLPSRGARDLVLWALGVPPSGVALATLAGWTLATAALAVWAYRRDEGRRFR
ncbi:MAG TPA: ABC transporter permease [Pseudonocardia sp.]|nr:ABC transporter permease [Pseudonocardia sp.]